MITMEPREFEAHRKTDWDLLYLSMVPAPTVLFCLTLLSDGLSWASGAAFLARLSQWLLLAGLACGLVAGLDAALRYISVGGIAPSRLARAHLAGNLLALLLSGSNLVFRWVGQHGAVAPAGVALSAAVACLLLATAWLGRDARADPKPPDAGDEDTLW
jgi:uncharacterized membrane protein